MVAPLRHQPSGPGARTCDPPPAGGARPELRLIVGGRGQPSGRSVVGGRPAGASTLPIGLVVLVAVVVLGGLGAIRALQGSPGPRPAGPSDASAVGAGRAPEGGAADRSPVVQPGPGDRVVVVRPGDSLWSIARPLAPGDDPRPIVAALIEANGGSSLTIGQQIVIPSQLLD